MSYTLPWAPIYAELPTHRKSIRLETLTGVRRAWTHVVELWLWCCRNRPDGDLADLPEPLLVEVCHWPRRTGLVKALKEAGFLNEDGKLHDWGEHTHQYLRIREGNRQRKQRERERRREAAPGPAGAEEAEYLACFRREFQAPHAEWTERARKEFPELMKRHGLGALLESVKRLSADEWVRKNWSLDQVCSAAGLDRGTRAPERPKPGSVAETQAALASPDRRQLGEQRLPRRA